MKKKLKKVLHNRHNHLRIVWRMIIYILIGIVVFLPFIPILKILPFRGGGEVASDANLAFVLSLNISFLLAAWITLKWVDRRPPALLGLNFWFVSLKEFAIGLGIGLANFTGVFLVLAAFGWLTVDWIGFSIADASVFCFYFANFLVFATFEELINRGYLFQAFCEGVGVPAAVIIVSLIFSLVHLMNEAFTILGGVFLFIHGAAYAVAYLKTRSLWTPIGFHMAWNFLQGPTAGMKVSGTSVDRSCFLTEARGPAILTGGDFGVEGGLVAIVISAIVLLVMLKADWLSPSARFLMIEREWKNRHMT